MSSANLVACLLFAGLVIVSANEILVDMDENAATPSCEKVYLVNHTTEVRVVSKGKAANGYCGVTVFTPADEASRYQCDGICVTFRSSSLATCEIKVKFTGHMFRNEGDASRDFDCHNTDKDPWCMDVNSMRVEVVESYKYAYVWGKRLYDFDIDISPRCSHDKKAAVVYNAHRQRQKDDEEQTYIEGLLVGLCLACVFLIVLLIMYCYYKHKAVSADPKDSKGDNNDKPCKRGTLLSTFRAKLPIGRYRSSSKSTEGTYRKRDSEETAHCGTSTMKSDEYQQAASELSADVQKEEVRPLTSSDSNYELATETAKPIDSGNDSGSSENAGNGAISDASTLVVNSGSHENLDKTTENV